MDKDGTIDISHMSAGERAAHFRELDRSTRYPCVECEKKEMHCMDQNKCESYQKWLTYKYLNRIKR